MVLAAPDLFEINRDRKFLGKTAQTDAERTDVGDSLFDALQAIICANGRHREQRGRGAAPGGDEACGSRSVMHEGLHRRGGGGGIIIGRDDRPYHAHMADSQGFPGLSGRGAAADPRDRALGVILAGGASSRMGTPKADLAWRGGQTMFAAAQDALAPLTAEVVVSGHGAPQSTLRRIADTQSGHGPLAALHDILCWAEREERFGPAAVVLICACDMPWLSTPLLGRLRDANASEMAVFESSERVHLLPMRVQVQVLPRLTELLREGRRSLHALMEAVACERVTASDDEMPQLRNVNTPEDLE